MGAHAGGQERTWYPLPPPFGLPYHYYYFYHRYRFTRITSTLFPPPLTLKIKIPCIVLQVASAFWERTQAGRDMKALLDQPFDKARRWARTGACLL